MHTKGKWEVKETKGYRTEIGCEFKIKEGVIQVAGGLITGENNKSDAEYICKCVNNHERMKEALKAALKTWLWNQKCGRGINQYLGEVKELLKELDND